MPLRPLVITLADGQRLVVDYETEITGLDNEALDTEVRAALVEVPHYQLQTRANGTTALFPAEVESIAFLNPLEE